MTEVEKWLNDYKRQHSWQETIVEVLRLYELSPMIERANPYSAFSSVLKLVHGIQDEPAWSYEVKNSVVNVFRVTIASLLGVPFANILVKEDMMPSSVARILTKELFRSTEVCFSAKDVSDYCRKCIDVNDEASMLYFLAGIALCSNPRCTTVASILSSIAFRLVFNCGVMIKVPDVLPVKTEIFYTPEAVGVFGKTLYMKQ